MNNFDETIYCDSESTIVGKIEHTPNWYPCPNYNPSNYKMNRHNIFGQGGVVNILALPQSYKVVDNLVPVINRDDTIQLAFKRVNQL